MSVLTRRFGVAVAALGVGAALTAAWRDLPAAPPLPPARAAAPNSPLASSTAPAKFHPPAPPRPQLPAPIAAASAASRIAIEGDDRAIDGAELAARTSVLTARDRRAWRLSELVPDIYSHGDAKIHALTSDGEDYILRGDGRGGDDVIVVRRSTGELYLGWLDGDPGDGRPLADAERPAERIERVTRIAVTAPVPAAPPPPAQLSVVVDGVPRPPLTADRFAAAARLAIQDQPGRATPAIDLAHAFGGTQQLVALVADGAHLAPVAPAGDARAVLYMNRRGRFKFAWIDAAGRPIGTAQREISEVALRSAPRITAAAP